MKILIAGNSQSAALKIAHDTNPEIFSKIGEVFFYVIPGGEGPYLKVENDKLILTSSNKDWHPYAAPASTPDMPVSSFDAVMISALGYIDGGYLYKNAFLDVGILPEFEPLEELKDKEIISDHCYQKIVTSHWRNNTHGFSFAKSLQESFKGKVFVQPFPRVSSALQNNNWWLRKCYKNYLGAHQFFSNAKDFSLRTLADEMGFNLLSYPTLTEDDAKSAFTPEHLMTDDCLHPKPEYAAIILKELASSLA